MHRRAIVVSLLAASFCGLGAFNAAEAKCRQRVHDRGEPHVVRAGEWSVQGWPVHANGWKREVLRSVRDDGFEVMPR